MITTRPAVKTSTNSRRRVSSREDGRKSSRRGSSRGDNCDTSRQIECQIQTASVRLRQRVSRQVVKTTSVKSRCQVSSQNSKHQAEVTTASEVTVSRRGSSRDDHRRTLVLTRAVKTSINSRAKLRTSIKSS